jgi:hypothetical protein
MKFSSSLAVLATFLIASSGTSVLALPTAQALYTETYAERAWRIEYTLYNLAEPGGGFDIFDFFLVLDSAKTLSAVDCPGGWMSIGWAPMDNETFSIEWFSLSSDTDVYPGDFLSGLAVTSAFQLGSLFFEVLFTNPDGDPLRWEGKTAPMISVPEPESVLLLVLGLVSLALLCRYVPILSGKR